RLEWRPPSDPVPVEVDPGRLGQVFGNVLSNAIKFSREGGRLHVTLDRDGEAAVVGGRAPRARLRARFPPLVFRLVPQRAEGRQGVAKRLVELHGGVVEVASDGDGRGTEVTVRLPLWLDRGHEGEQVAMTDGSGTVARLDGVRILLVEDSVDTGDATRLLLE